VSGVTYDGCDNYVTYCLDVLQIWDKLGEPEEVREPQESPNHNSPSDQKAKQESGQNQNTSIGAEEAYCHAVYGSIHPPTLPTGAHALLLKFRKPRVEYLPEEGV
jgi:hypothetical protein